MFDNQIDYFAVQWLTTKRSGTDDENGAVLARVHALAQRGFPICVALFERAYVELLSEEAIEPFREKLAVDAAPAAHSLTVEEYRSIPAAVIAKRYMRERAPGGFRDQVDSLIKGGLV